MNAKDLESIGWDLADSGRRDLLQRVGVRIWSRWADEIERGKHPRRPDLLAFLRVWVAPVGDWLPPGMAYYLADRLDPDRETPEPIGRPPLSDQEKSKKEARDLSLALDVLVSWREHRQARTPYPQQAAFHSVAKRSGLHEVDVRVAFSRHRKRAEIVDKVRGGASMESLTNADIEVLTADGDDLWSLVLMELTDDELRRLSAGESHFRVLGR